MKLFEEELNAIRIKLYEQTKDMTSEEQVAFFSNMVKEGFLRHGISSRYMTVPPVRRQVEMRTE